LELPDEDDLNMFSALGVAHPDDGRLRYFVIPERATQERPTRKLSGRRLREPRILQTEVREWSRSGPRRSSTSLNRSGEPKSILKKTTTTSSLGSSYGRRSSIENNSKALTNSIKRRRSSSKKLRAPADIEQLPISVKVKSKNPKLSKSKEKKYKIRR